MNSFFKLQSHTGRLIGLWFLPKLAQGLNNNNDDDDNDDNNNDDDDDDDDNNNNNNVPTT